MFPKFIWQSQESSFSMKFMSWDVYDIMKQRWSELSIHSSVHQISLWNEFQMSSICKNWRKCQYEWIVTIKIYCY